MSGPKSKSLRPWLLALATLLFLLLLALLSLWWWGFGAGSLRRYDEPGPGAERAVFFDGKALRLPASLAGPGPIRVVHFWDPQCPCHRETDAHLNYLIGLYRYSNVSFYSVRKPGTQGEMVGFLQGKLAELPGIDGMETLPASPSVAIWDAQGNLAYAGPYSEGLVCNSANSFVEPVLNALADGRRVSSINTAAVGCYCPWAGQK